MILNLVNQSGWMFQANAYSQSFGFNLNTGSSIGVYYAF